MKKHLYYICLISLSCFAAHGQDTSGKRITTRIVMSRTTTGKLDTNTLVYDEHGNALHYYQYTKLLNTGDYTIRYNGIPHTPDVKGYLTKTDPQLTAKLYPMIKAKMAIKSPVLQEGKVLDITPLLGSFTKEELNKKAVILLFWSVECPPCTEDFLSISDYLKQIPNPDDMIVIAITRDPEQKVTAKMMQKPLVYARFYNNAGDVLNEYQLNSVPAYVVADKDHIIRFALAGSSPYTMPVFKNAIKQALAQ